MKKSTSTLALYAGVMSTVLIGLSYSSAKKIAIWDSFKWMWPDPWFKVTMLDLYFGFGLVSAFIFYREKSLIKGVVWTALLAGLGNIVTGIYLLVAIQESKKKSVSWWEAKRHDYRLF